MDLLYADNHVFAANKPPGLLTQPSGTDEDNLEDRVKAWIRETHDKSGNVYLHAVHRLDRVVSGVVLFGRTEKAVSRLNATMREGRVVKIYHAVVTGAPRESEGTLENAVAHEDHRARIVPEGTPGSQTARLAYRTLASRGERRLLEIRLETGRYHQIRVQLAAIRCPVVGDTKYGSRVAYAKDSIALHHARLEAIHPTRKDALVVLAPYPASWPWNEQGGDP